MNAPFTAVHLTTYEAADNRKVMVLATAGAAAGSLAAVITTPLYVVKMRLQCQGVRGCYRYAKNSIGKVIENVMKRDGYGGLMSGWVPRMLFHAPAAAAICSSTYEA